MKNEFRLRARNEEQGSAREKEIYCGIFHRDDILISGVR